MTYVNPDRGGVAGFVRRSRAKLRHLGKRLAQRLANPGRISRVAFLVGCGRSGTDLIAAKLGSAWGARLVNEDDPAGFEDWRLLPLDRIDGLVEREHARVIVFKPIVETYRVGELLGHFEGSRAIFMTRNVDDTVNSRVAFFGDRNRAAVRSWVESDFEAIGSWPVARETRDAVRSMYEIARSVEDAAAIYWYLYNSAYVTLDLPSDPRVILTVYEDVVTRPQDQLARLCEHVGLEFHPDLTRDIFRSSVRKKPPPELEPRVRGACDDLWRRIISGTPAVP